MKLERKSGILLHITSLPNNYGIGDLGPSAYDFIDFLENSKQSLWQILPIGPTNFLDSPYTPFSAFAGNHYLISPQKLVDDHLITMSEIIPPLSDLATWKFKLLHKAYQNFIKSKSNTLTAEYHSFCQANQSWLPDYGLFMALKTEMKNISWTEWPEDIRRRNPQTLDQVRKKLVDKIQFQQFIQYLFHRQWTQLKQNAHKKGITIIGDLPLFVAHDSVDVWANPQLFNLKDNGQPRTVAGVPPDYFSKTGQLWGNPLYNWEYHRQTKYQWWIDRFTTLLKYVDLVRIDHFRGLESYWEVPSGETTAINGKWQPGPGSEILHHLNQALGGLPMIAEDLGFIDQKVIDLRKQWDLPGMRVLQFAFEELKSNIHSPHEHSRNSVVYTGTHDNNTSIGWFHSASPEIQNYTRNYLGTDGTDIAWDLIRSALRSPAAMAVIPLQDVLALASNARMNTPGTIVNNWQWRYHAKDLTAEISQRLGELTTIYGRNPH